MPVGDERRALQLFNPGLDGRWATTNNLIAAMQILLPGEVARAHRHTPTAIRFIIEGTGAYTAVDGERVYMAPGDLILTPSWAWHDHGNETKDRVVWMDGLDIPLIAVLGSDVLPVLFGPAGAGDPARPTSPEAVRPCASDADLGEGEALNPRRCCSTRGTRPGKRSRSLREQEGSAHDGIALEYRHPQTGGPVLPTMAC